MLCSPCGSGADIMLNNDAAIRCRGVWCAHTAPCPDRKKKKRASKRTWEKLALFQARCAFVISWSSRPTSSTCFEVSLWCSAQTEKNTIIIWSMDDAMKILNSTEHLIHSRWFLLFGHFWSGHLVSYVFCSVCLEYSYNSRTARVVISVHLQSDRCVTTKRRQCPW